MRRERDSWTEEVEEFEEEEDEDEVDVCFVMALAASHTTPTCISV